MSLALVIAFTVLALLCLLALLWSRWPGWLKGLLVVGVTVFYFYGEALVHETWGWPSADALPERFVLLAAVIEEPGAKTAGALYVWVNAIEDGKPVRQPRAYRLPYTKDLHALLNEGMKKIRQGVSQVGTSEPRAGRGGLSWLRPGNDEQVVKIRDMPKPQLPEK
ncbi:hypothetical protein ABXN37_04685 [Piscinibacter sakaiensis]|uniref:Uncharacterized protein n=1 Tax=Piscinibacter sakaiensis TaxID=1547922 RepID=A0A0K8NVY5_PISS1|nr:hypothetical protein [Piscinibacter sakaiensis]GAP34444.1 hypothetical protein ISF6_4619 [Piscinibacter sakaiensis]